jgi:hypothetical protein
LHLLLWAAPPPSPMREMGLCLDPYTPQSGKNAQCSWAMPP